MYYFSLFLFQIKLHNTFCDYSDFINSVYCDKLNSFLYLSSLLLRFLLLLIPKFSVFTLSVKHLVQLRTHWFVFVFFYQSSLSLRTHFIYTSYLYFVIYSINNVSTHPPPHTHNKQPYPEIYLRRWTFFNVYTQIPNWRLVFCHIL